VRTRFFGLSPRGEIAFPIAKVHRNFSVGVKLRTSVMEPRNDFVSGDMRRVGRTGTAGFQSGRVLAKFRPTVPHHGLAGYLAHWRASSP
jgi:hypothetical protein